MIRMATPADAAAFAECLRARRRNECDVVRVRSSFDRRNGAAIARGAFARAVAVLRRKRCHRRLRLREQTSRTDRLSLVGRYERVRARSVARAGRRPSIVFETLLTLLRAQGFCAAHAGVTLPNAASVALHEAFGFRPIGVYEKSVTNSVAGTTSVEISGSLELSPRTDAPLAAPLGVEVAARQLLMK